MGTSVWGPQHLPGKTGAVVHTYSPGNASAAIKLSQDQSG